MFASQVFWSHLLSHVFGDVPFNDGSEGKGGGREGGGGKGGEGGREGRGVVSMLWSV